MAQSKKNFSIRQNPDALRAQRLAVCSLLAGIVSVLFSCCFPSGVPGGAIGIVLALLSRNADPAEKKKFLPQAMIGIVLSCVAIGITLILCYLSVSYFEALRDPVLGPQLNQMMEQILEQVNQMQRQIYGTAAETISIP